MTEQQRHTVVRAFPGFDVRRYPDSVVVQVLVTGEFAHAAHRGARLLQRYLAGENQPGAVVDVAAPVLLERVGESSWLVSVILPDVQDPGLAPVPADESVRVCEVPGHEAAVQRFTGGLNTLKFTERGRELLVNVRAGGLEPVGDVYFARFHPAGKPGFLTQNEALVWVTSA